MGQPAWLPCIYASRITHHASRITHHGGTPLSDTTQAQSRNYIETLVLALGGNAIQSSGERGTSEEQFANVSNAMASVAELADRGYRVVLTHGNGPQVGT